jgi:hypothetical protein
MIEHETAGKELTKGAGRLLEHVGAIALGLILMIAGLAMGVTVVALPVGVPLGLVGLGVFLWGLFGWSLANKGPSQP